MSGIVTIDNLSIVGIQIRTSNQNNRSIADIGKLWGDYYAQGIPEKVKHKADDRTYVIYTGYENNFQGEYDVIVGSKVTKYEEPPSGLTYRKFPMESFATFTAKGVIPNIVIDLWTQIWKEDTALKRKYTYDFEVYEASQPEENRQVTIYIASSR